MHFISFINYELISIAVLTSIKFGFTIILSVYRVLTVIGLTEDRWSALLAPYFVTGSFRMIIKMFVPLCKIQIHRLFALVN
jgi:hypothetical protein